MAKPRRSAIVSKFLEEIERDGTASQSTQLRLAEYLNKRRNEPGRPYEWKRPEHLRAWYHIATKHLGMKPMVAQALGAEKFKCDESTIRRADMYPARFLTITELPDGRWHAESAPGMNARDTKTKKILAWFDLREEYPHLPIFNWTFDADDFQ
ncbi:MAG: hypothetical protein H7A12_04420 [Pseudomonadales bacterium]|jgi:hypothetical protein|nr:hypothetical protein [Pseudomonadales bacterium]MCP5320056.1 hypothetical protein [Pseudomonadales bacterium]